MGQRGVALIKCCLLGIRDERGYRDGDVAGAGARSGLT